MIASCVSVGDADYVSATPDYLCRTPMQCEFSEYFCFGPPLLGGNSHPPLRESDIRHESETSPYQKFTPGEDFQHESQFAHPAHEHILIGQTLREHEDAWGAGGFNFTGRVHDNGRIVFSRQPKDDESETPETWVFEGHLRYGTALVGAFRSSSADGPCGVQGIFSLRKRAEAPMQ
ncbi:hypothetical protein C8R44DRAFT_690502 [Mycena epipterygia]|nr:hypothetical protein C8R44DRAFT_690502 [Mycena epipterygia]